MPVPPDSSTGVPRARRRWRGAALFAVTSVLALAAAEVAVRMLAPQATAFTGHGMYVADADVGYTLQPGHTWRNIAVNSHGMRDVERKLAKPAGCKRVLVLGDSFAFGSKLDLEQLFPRVLERELGSGVQVINTGVPGYSTVQERAFLQKFGLVWQPDAVVVAFFVGNDLWENLGTREVRIVDGEIVRDDTGDGDAAANPPSLLMRVMMRSHLVRMVRALFTHSGSQRTWYLNVESRRLPVCARTGTAAATEYEPGWQVARAELGRIRDAVAPRPTVVLVIPDEFQVDPQLRGAVVQQFKLDPGDYDFDLPQRRLAQICKDLALPLVDPLAELRARTAAGERMYIDNDSHWNQAGNELAGRALAAELAPKLEVVGK